MLNGIQTQSGYCYNLINEQVSMAGLVDVVRLSPQDLSTPELVAAFRANQQGIIRGAHRSEGLQRLLAPHPGSGAGGITQLMP